MSERVPDPWADRPEPCTAPVPARYRGVWQRRLLQTPDSRDESSWVRWLQLGRWHADLRVPQAARPGMTPPLHTGLRLQQGFAGITQVETGADGEEICTWHRLVDYQPPGASPDAGHMRFETAERLIETGVHGVYHEVWERLEGSLGPARALAQAARADGLAPVRLFMAGRYLMRVQPWPGAWRPEFEISFGPIDTGTWHIERSTRPELEGRHLAVQIERTAGDEARVAVQGTPGQPWRILAWED